MWMLTKLSVLVLALVLGTASVFAGELKTITLDVDNMTCGMCPITVKKALKQLDGVKDVEAKYEGDGKGWAKVTYDTESVTIDALTFATEEAGYPSRVPQPQ